MLRKIISIFVALSVGFLASCTNEKNYEARLDQWIGKSEKELVSNWGIPDKQYQLDANTRMLSYVNRNTVYYPGTVSTCFGVGGHHTMFNNCAGTGMPPTTQTYACETIFTLQQGRVARWGHKGNNCRA
jgi:hypothetical protein